MLSLLWNHDVVAFSEIGIYFCVCILSWMLAFYFEVYVVLDKWLMLFSPLGKYCIILRCCFRLILLFLLFMLWCVLVCVLEVPYVFWKFCSIWIEFVGWYFVWITFLFQEPFVIIIYFSVFPKFINERSNMLPTLFARNWSWCSLKPFYKWSTIGASSFTLMLSQKEKGMLNRFILSFTLSLKRKSGQSTDLHARSSTKMSCFGSQLSYENDVLLTWVGFFMRMSCCI